MKKSIFFILSVIALTVLLALCVSAEVGSVKLETLGERGAPVIDGDVSDEIWESVPVTVINKNNCNTSWSYRSLVNGEAELKILASDDGLYICAKVYDYTLVLSSGKNDVALDDSGYNTDDDYYGYNGDLFILALDPFCELEANDNTRNNKGIWYTFAPHIDSTLRVFRSNPDYADITSSVSAAYIKNDRGYDFEAFIPYTEVIADYERFEDMPSHTAAEFAQNGTKHTASVLYMDRYVYNSFTYVRTADGNLIDYDSQLKEYATAHHTLGTTYTISRWGTTCDMIPRDNIAGNLGNGVAAKLHGIYLTVDTEHKCTPEANPVEDEATCTYSGKTYCKCSECGTKLTYTQRGFAHNLGEWTVVRAASCQFGIEGKYCKDCNTLVYQRMTPSLGKHSDGAPVNPEWAEVLRKGDKRVLYCTMCDCYADFDKNTIPLIYSDINSGSWYAAACADMYNRDIMTGTSSKLFSPDSTVTRAMFVQVLAKLSGAALDKQAHSTFIDVPDGKWYTAAVCWAYEKGITGGVDATHFAPDSGVSREQIAVFLMKYAAITGRDTRKRADISSCTDASKISSWAKNAMQWAAAEKIITGTSPTTLSPKKLATRAQVAQIINGYGK